MDIDLSYGRDGHSITLFHNNIEIIKPQFFPVLVDESAAIRSGLRSPIGTKPLSDHVNPGDSVVIVHTDITRATPNERILPVILDELETAGVKRDEITLLNGLGTHRSQTDEELRGMLGDFIVENYRCTQHDCFDGQNLISIGKTSFGHPVRINRSYMEADVKILTGFIEPHFFAGFSGGPKAILPSLSGSESVFTNHGFEMIAHPNATWGITYGNPIWEEMLEVAKMTEPTFLLNVTLNSNREITGVFAGNMEKSHKKGCEFVQQSAMVPIDEPYDIVITTNSGYPLDQNLYQSVKGLSAAKQIVKRGGVIIIATACEDGLPDHGRYAELLHNGGSPDGIIEMVSQTGYSAHDQWQVQVQAQIQLHADVYVYSDGLSGQQIESAQFKASHNIEKTVEGLINKYGPETRICVLPEGPLTIPYLDVEQDG